MTLLVRPLVQPRVQQATKYFDAFPGKVVGKDQATESVFSIRWGLDFQILQKYIIFIVILIMSV